MILSLKFPWRRNMSQWQAFKTQKYFKLPGECHFLKACYLLFSGMCSWCKLIHLPWDQKIDYASCPLLMQYLEALPVPTFWRVGLFIVWTCFWSMLSILGSWDFISNSSGIILGGLSKSITSGLEIRMEITMEHYRDVIIGIHGSLPGFPTQKWWFLLSQ